MEFLPKPWNLFNDRIDEFNPEHCLLFKANCQSKQSFDYSTLLKYNDSHLCLIPYPKSGRSKMPPIKGMPQKPRTASVYRGKGQKSTDSQTVDNNLNDFHNVLARVDELRVALDDPANLWAHLQCSWDRAEQLSNPRMAEIVRQAEIVKTFLVDLRMRVRRVLRRSRELTPLQRVQEMDRASMLWLVKQPGRTNSERAGSTQRVLAISRHESFDTLENRVLHSYLRLAYQLSKQWLQENKSSEHGKRYGSVLSYCRYCRQFADELRSLGVRETDPVQTTNYVLMHDRSYRAVNVARTKLLRQETAEEDLWCWQAQCWTDFCILAIVLALRKLNDAEMLYQSPLIWLEHSNDGMQFQHDNPLAVFWLKKSGLIVEVMGRPKGTNVSKQQFEVSAHVWLEVAKLGSSLVDQKIPVWTPHIFTSLNLAAEVDRAQQLLWELSRQGLNEPIHTGLILMPAHGKSGYDKKSNRNGFASAIAMDAVGTTLKEGKTRLAEFVSSCFTQDSG